MRNVWILFLAQALAACGTIMLVTFGGIIGARIAPNAALSTLPLSLGVIGVAATTIPAAMLMQRIGRKPAFVASALVSATAALLIAWATAHSRFAILCAASLLIGAGQAFVLQYRFAATEHVPAESAGRAVSIVMLGTLAAAILGPELGHRTRFLGGWTEFTGSFLALAALLIAAAIVLLGLDPPVIRKARADTAARPMRDIAAQPAFIVAVLAGVTSYAVMSFIMTATPISMHIIDGLSVRRTTQVISAHLLAMYLPSLAGGWLTRVLGEKRMMLIGSALMATCVGIAALIGQHFAHYLVALVLLGIGWNLLFVAGTTLLTRTYSAAERFRVQGVNDFAIFGVQALVSLLAGHAIQALGWATLNLASLPLLAATAAAVAWLHAHDRRVQEAAVRLNRE